MELGFTSFGGPPPKQVSRKPQLAPFDQPKSVSGLGFLSGCGEDLRLGPEPQVTLLEREALISPFRVARREGNTFWKELVVLTGVTPTVCVCV